MAKIIKRRKPMNKADYSYELKTENGRKVCAIVDLNLGGMSVINAIEDVVEEISSAENIQPVSVMWIYKDSEGMWDGWDVRNENFVHLMCIDEKVAIDKYCDRDATVGTTV